MKKKFFLLSLPFMGEGRGEGIFSIMTLMLFTSCAYASSFELSSTNWKNNQPIPAIYRCHNDTLPDFIWHNPPAGTKSFALILKDPDAVSVAGKLWHHVVMYNIPATDKILNIKHVTFGKNSWEQYAYGAPCPPAKTGVHHYQAMIYALNLPPHLPEKLTIDQLTRIMTTHVLNSATFVSVVNSDE